MSDCYITIGHCNVTTSHCNVTTGHCNVTTEHCNVTTVHCNITMSHCNVTYVHCITGKTLLQHYNAAKTTEKIIFTPKNGGCRVNTAGFFVDK